MDRVCMFAYYSDIPIPIGSTSDKIVLMNNLVLQLERDDQLYKALAEASPSPIKFPMSYGVFVQRKNEIEHIAKQNDLLHLLFLFNDSSCEVLHKVYKPYASTALAIKGIEHFITTE